MNKKLIPAALAALMLTPASLMAAENQSAVNETATAAEFLAQSEPPAKKISLGSAGELTISGYLQAQWQLAQEKGIPALSQGGSFGSNIDNRFMVRRGRIKFTYNYGIVQMVVQPDFTEKGVGIKDAYLSVASPSKVIAGQAGLFDRPFGYEISYSSSRRESPERSQVYLALFPGERDLGAMLTLRGAKGTWLNDFTFNAGMFNGNGIGSETDSRKDFIGRLAWLHKFSEAQLGAAFSYYYGGIYNPVNTNYRSVSGEGFVEQTGVEDKYSMRQYLGFAAQYSQEWGAGTTHIRAEYLWGKNPGTQNKNANPGGTSFGAGGDPIFLRSFRGAYVYLIQDIGQSKHSVVFKYDHYDPNIRIKGDDIGRLANTGIADIAYNTYGIGYIFNCNSSLRLMAYYDIVVNEKSQSLASADPVKDFSRNVKDNVLTLRVQVKF